MEYYHGVLEVDYNHETKKIPYTMDKLGGDVHIYYCDKNGHDHGFFYREIEDIWVYKFNKSLRWPIEFSQLFFRECKKEAIKHGLIK